MGNLAIKRLAINDVSYLEESEKYKSYFIGDWYVSGDSAYKDEDGYFWFQDVLMM